MYSPTKNKAQKLLIAHRGESFDAPENTLAAINLAWEREIKSVEIDIHLTKDKEIVVIHDNNTRRVSGIKKTIKHSTLEELKLIDVGLHKGEKWKNERIPTLSEVLKTIPGQGTLIIEIKSNELLLLNKLKYELTLSGLNKGQIILIGFNRKTLTRAKQLMPDYKMLWLLNLDYFWPWWLCRAKPQQIIKKLETMNLDGVDVWAGKLLTRQFIKRFRKHGLLVFCWTVDDPHKAQKLLEFGIDGITTNKATWMAKQLKFNILNFNKKMIV